jgi:proline-specific peptidase
MGRVKDGYLSVKEHRIYYKIFGVEQTAKSPLLVLHGGPGSAHNYMLGLSALATDRPVVFYDQLGCGLSDHPDDVSLSTVQTFVDELAQVRRQLKLDDIHLLGHSWGGMLAIEYLLTQPQGIRSATLASAMISMSLYRQEVDLLKRELPKDVYEAMTAHEQAGTTDTNAYWKQLEAYNRQHIYRGDHYPEEYEAPKDGFGVDLYQTMWDASEAYADGSLKDWDKIDELPKITVPTLITSGQYDELTPHQALIAHRQRFTDRNLHLRLALCPH